MLAAHLAHHLLSHPALLDVCARIAEEALTPGHARGARVAMNERLLAEGAAALELRGTAALHQVEGARLRIEGLLKEQTARIHGTLSQSLARAHRGLHDQSAPLGPAVPLMVVALCSVARAIFTHHRGEVMFRPAGLLLWREQWSGRTLIEPLRVAATELSCLEEDGERLAWAPRVDALHPRHALPFVEAALPPVADLDVLRLRAQGLYEPHRHQSLSRLSTFAWLGMLYEDLALDEQTEDDPLAASSPTARLRQSRALCRAIDALLDLREERGPREPALDRRWYEAELDAWRAVRGGFLPGAAEAQPLGGAAVLRQDVDERSIAQRRLAADRRRLSRCLRALAGHHGAPPPSVLGLALHALLLCRAQLEGRLIQPAQRARGLDRFKKRYVDHALTRAFQLPWQDHWRQAWEVGGVRHLELKVGPNSVAMQAQALIDALRRPDRGAPDGVQLSAVLGPDPDAARDPRSARSSPAERLTQPDPAAKRPGLRLHVHFLREEQHRAPEAALVAPRPRWAGLRAKLVDQAEALRIVMDTDQYGPLIAAIDVASSELAAPAEVFAPAFAALRRPGRLQRAEALPDGQRSHVGQAVVSVSVHAGEEFEHLVGGMRQIDEHIRFLHLRKGDRLGHALAVGIDPADWRGSSVGGITVAKQARLDDLVWLDRKLTYLPTWSHLCLRIRDEISALCGELYGQGFDPPTLYEAWKLRELDPFGFNRGEPKPEPEAEPRLRPRPREAERGEHQLYPGPWAGLRREGRERLAAASREARLLWEAYTFHPEVRAGGEERLDVRLDPTMDAPLRAVQEHMLRKIVRRDLCIEACPSSNLAIGMLGRIAKHPIFRWLPVRAAERCAVPTLRVLVGSDDPAVFHTELVHEYALLAEAARELGHSPAEVRDWLELLRKNAEDMSFALGD